MSSGRIKLAGIVSIVLGVILAITGAALLVVVLPLLDQADARQHLVALLLFGNVLLTGTIALAGGIHMVRFGRRSTALTYAMIVCVVLFGGLCFLVIKAFPDAP